MRPLPGRDSRLGRGRLALGRAELASLNQSRDRELAAQFYAASVNAPSQFQKAASGIGDLFGATRAPLGAWLLS